jgi:hypothetical protein
MNYNKIVSVTGLSGLFELVSSKADGGIVRSLEDQSTRFVSNRVHNFSHLESIEIFTTKDNVNMVDIFTEMKNSKEPLPDGKADAKAIKAYFEKVYPDMDFERVYGRNKIIRSTGRRKCRKYWREKTSGHCKTNFTKNYSGKKCTAEEN